MNEREGGVKGRREDKGEREVLWKREQVTFTRLSFLLDLGLGQARLPHGNVGVEREKK